MVRLVIESDPVPVLVSVTVCGLLVLPTSCSAKVRLVGLSDTAGPPELTPVPETDRDCGLSGASSVRLKVADRLPVAAGVNETLMVQLLPAATAVEQVFVWLKSPGLVPLNVIEVTFRFLFPVFVTVTFKGELVVPT